MSGTIAVSLSEVCNLRCRMCGAHASTTPRRMLDPAVWEKLLDFMPAGWSMEINAAGEHTLHYALGELLGRLRVRHPDSALLISTNGQWQQPERVLTALKGAPDRRVVRFSIDGTTEETYRWVRNARLSDVCDNVNRAEKAGFEIEIASIAMQRTIAEIPRFPDLLPHVRRYYIMVLHVCVPDLLAESIFGRRDDYMAAVEALRKRGGHVSADLLTPASAPGCSFPNYPWIDTTGMIYPCCHRWDLPIGRIGETSFQQYLSMAPRIAAESSHPFCQSCYRATGPWPWEAHFRTEQLYTAWRNLGTEDSKDKQ